MALKEPVALAIEQIKKALPEAQVRVRQDGQGGAYVVVDSVELGGAFVPPSSWIGFRITFQYPYADVYPHFISLEVNRRGGQPLAGPGIQAGQAFEGRPAYQLSRRSKRLNPQTDTALLKLEKVVSWLRSS